MPKPALHRPRRDRSPLRTRCFRGPIAGRRTGAGALAAAAVVALVVAACTTSVPPTRWHTLLPADLGAAARPAGEPARPSVAYALAPLRMPAQVDRPQWLVRHADETVAVLEQTRWASPLRDELRQALVAALATRGDAHEAIGPAPTGEAGPARITVEWRRFESLPGREARAEGTWIVQPAVRVGTPSPAPRRCDFLYREAAPGAHEAVAAAHRRIVVRLAGAIGDGLRGGPCPPEDGR